MKKIKMFGFFTNRKAQKKVQKDRGRSMVEMLGVLAIIGVLSIGGIAGYNMAMNRYRANEILDMASKLSVAAQSAGSTAENNKAWQNAMYSVANEFGEEAWESYYSDNAMGVNGPYESTYSVWDNGDVRVFVKSNQSALRNAIDSVTGISNVSQDGSTLIKANR